jgi:beta-N-acetylhexosaminidase
LRQALSGPRLRARADSHTALPRDGRSLKAILADDAAPYGWLGSVLDAVMAAHVVYPRVDACPAGYSARWLQAVLRGRLGFGGAIFTDDLSMEAARHIEGRAISPVEAVRAALDAGCDLALLCNQSVGLGAELDGLIDGLTEAQLKGQWLPDERSEERRLALLPGTRATVWDDLMVQAAYMQALDLLP